jgi:hypothetical protein
MRASYYLMLIATCVLAHSAFGAVRHVPQQYPTIQTAIDAAENGDTVLVDHGTYYENIRFRGKAIIVASRYLVDANVVHIDSTIINGSQPTDPDSGSTVFFVSDEDTNSVLCGMTITGGTGVLIAGIDQRHGGGIYVSSSSGATIRHNRIVSNSVSHNNIAVGGGVLAGSPYVGGGWLVLENNMVLRNTLSANNAVDGGGVCCTMNARIVTNRIERNLGFTGGVGDDGAGLSCFTFVQGGKQLLVSGNIVTGNEFTSTGMDQYGQSGLGGGIAIVGFRGIVENNIITYNQLEGPEVLLGGGLMLSHCSTPLECRGNWICHNTLVGGKVQRGGGVFIYQCNPLLYNNIVVENEGKDGGGIYVGDPSSPSHAILVNNTICSNIGVLASGIYSHASYPVVINSIVWNDGPEICQEGGVISVA